RVWRPLARWPRVVRAPVRGVIRRFALWQARRPSRRAFASNVFFEARSMEYWLGVAEAGGMPERRRAVVLAYHSLLDLSKDPILAPYGTPAALFERQIDSLRRLGCNFIGAGEFLDFIEG